MAYKAGAPLIPLSIVGSGKVMPANWMFPCRPTNGCKVIIHELGHSYGLVHCTDPACVMRSATYVEDIDLKKHVFCMKCEEQVVWATGSWE